MNTDIKATVRTALLENSALISLLGGERIYQLAAPKAEEFPRITFFELDNASTHFADDKAFAAGISVQIDVWSKDSTSAITEQVNITMTELGFARTSAIDLYEQENAIYHKALRYRTHKEE